MWFAASDLENSRISYSEAEHKLHWKIKGDLSLVKIKDIRFGGAVIEYDVKIGNFSVQITMFNIDGRAPKITGTVYGFGRFGSVYQSAVKNMVAKRIALAESMTVFRQAEDGVHLVLNIHVAELYDVLFECAISKLMDLLGVGPKIMSKGFDVMCYRNCAEIFM